MMNDNIPPLDNTRKVVIVGAGPVGCLAAIAFAKMNWQVEIYEARPDLRLSSSKAAAQQRSINLAISSRGIAALQAVDASAAGRFLQTVIPMRGRMIHDIHGNLQSQPYDRDGQCINSIDRGLLNIELLEEASALPNIRLNFKYKVLSADFDQGVLFLQDDNSGTDVRANFDLCIGADGSYSIIRRQLMRVVRMNFQQEYIPHEYIELKMPAGHDEHGNPAFLLDPNHLHIWPRHSFMLIALPNKDKTFTCTLFAPTVEFDRLITREDILLWFQNHFPDALSLLGEDKLLKDFEKNPRSPLITTKLTPYHYKDRCVILGDAAHSMVPFYGQGLNSGLEDVRVLLTLLQEECVVPRRTIPNSGDPGSDFTDQRLAKALSRYSANRHEDAVAICELAMDNYIEMRHSVTTPAYTMKKALDYLLFSLTAHRPTFLSSLGDSLSRTAFPTTNPRGWLPLYTMVTFRPDISYATARRKAARQTIILTTIARLATVGMCATSFYFTWRVLRWLRSQRLHR
ncbi:FAD/NAD(P)-binding domain-containing protein [Suillus bovinus]|uniref:FAD/NAD(P)-binding domain-containing protein n=1 Tax=Suillus bovinus TaxID=48563 RepID=UPI001B86896F|nr:FAD/NAD(P)-binding domain-containing protein [Suillus bovinus]KAG2158353.1 FAD/NAD(P)-binding domain-containing protein [Suillus bovinus]